MHAQEGMSRAGNSRLAVIERSEIRLQYPDRGEFTACVGRTYSVVACVALQVLQVRDGSVSIKELSDMTAIKTDDIISTLQHLNLIQYQKGQHVICAAPSVIDRTLKAAGSPGLEVRSTSPWIRSLLPAASFLCMSM